jgi:Flp pilus assembly protein TadG
MSAACKRLRSLGTDSRGAVAIIFAFSLLPLLGMAAGAVDFASVSRARTRMQAAADAAALAAAQTYRGGAIARADESGEAFFHANIDPRVIEPVAKVRTGRIAGTVTATVNYSGSQPVTFMKIFGTSAVRVSGTAVASVAQAEYTDIYVIIDNSESMSIAANRAGQNKLKQKTVEAGNAECYFGCHAPSEDELDHSPKTNYEIAHAAGVDLRIDVVKEATKEMLQRAESVHAAPYTRFTIFTTNTTYENRHALSADYRALQASVNDILPSGTDSMFDVMFDNALVSLRSGDGSAPEKSKKYLFIMTDGVVDKPEAYSEAAAEGWGHWTAPFSKDWCLQLKAQDVTVAVIYATYIPDNGEGRYDALVRPFIRSLAPNLSACASPGYYFEAREGDEIRARTAELARMMVGDGLIRLTP